MHIGSFECVLKYASGAVSLAYHDPMLVGSPGGLKADRVILSKIVGVRESCAE